MAEIECRMRNKQKWNDDKVNAINKWRKNKDKLRLYWTKKKINLSKGKYKYKITNVKTLVNTSRN